MLKYILMAIVFLSIPAFAEEKGKGDKEDTN
jgi:hypothetical protein